MPVASSPKTYDCELCGASLQSKWALDNHLCLFHDQCGTVRPGAEITFRCAVCDASFGRRSELIQHMESSGHGSASSTAETRSAARRGARGSTRGAPRGRG